MIPFPIILGITFGILITVANGIQNGLSKKQIVLVTTISVACGLIVAGILKIQDNQLKGRTYVQYDSYDNF